MKAGFSRKKETSVKSLEELWKFVEDAYVFHTVPPGMTV